MRVYLQKHFGQSILDPHLSFLLITTGDSPAAGRATATNRSAKSGDFALDAQRHLS
jgi:hypothetical protein